MRSATLALLLLASLALPAAAQQPTAAPDRGAVLTVKGEGSTEVTPDYALFAVVVATGGRTLDEAATVHQERATRALAMLQGLKPDGIEIERSTFRLNQDRPPPRDPQRVPVNPVESAFTAETMISLKVKPIAVVNASITKLAASGLFEVRSIDFRVEQERAALNQARRAAMIDAREQAQVYADAGELRLLEIIEIADGEARPVIRESAADLPLPRFVQIIPPATVEFDASVNVTWRIAPR